MKHPLQLRPAGLAAITAIAIILVVGSPLASPRTADGPVSLVLGTPSAPIRLGDYLVRTRSTGSGPYRASSLARHPGRIVPFRIANLTPAAEDPCQLRWTVVDHLRKVEAEEGDWRYEEVLGWPDGLIVPSSSPASEVAGEVWVPLPNPLVDVGQFFIRFRLSCGELKMATAETERFRVDPNQLIARTPGVRPLAVPPAPPVDTSGGSPASILEQRRIGRATPGVADIDPLSAATPTAGPLDVAPPAS